MRVDLDVVRSHPRHRERGPARKLVAAVTALAGGHATVLRHGEQPWASITFAGARHTLTLAFAGAEGIAAGEAFLTDLPEHEFALPGHLVADAAIRAVDHTLLPEPRLTVTAELLLLDDG